MERNRIPRNATALEVTFKKDTCNHKAGEVIIVKKNEWGDWSGGGYCWFIDTLRDGNIFSLKVLETKEKN